MRRQFYKILNKYLSHWDLSVCFEAHIYSQYKKMNGNKGVKALIGFVKYAENPDNDITKLEISGTLGHDINGALKEDEFLLPRSSSYGKFYKEETK